MRSAQAVMFGLDMPLLPRSPFNTVYYSSLLFGSFHSFSSVSIHFSPFASWDLHILHGLAFIFISHHTSIFFLLRICTDINDCQILLVYSLSQVIGLGRTILFFYKPHM
jgi:hypothetical protein